MRKSLRYPLQIPENTSSNNKSSINFQRLGESKGTSFSIHRSFSLILSVVVLWMLTFQCRNQKKFCSKHTRQYNWTHLTCLYEQSQFIMYINGTSVSQVDVFLPNYEFIPVTGHRLVLAIDLEPRLTTLTMKIGVQAPTTIILQVEWTTLHIGIDF